MSKEQFRLYATAQSRDDRTTDIVESGHDGFVLDYTERKRIQDIVEELAPYSETKTILLKSRKNWLSGYLVPDSPGPAGRRRPVQFVACEIEWKAIAPATLADLVVASAKRLLDDSEMSEARWQKIRRKVLATANWRKRFLGCFPAACIAFAVAFAVILFLFL